MVVAVDRATARVRIYTPTYEMPFAGHPTLGTAHVVRALKRCGDAVALEMKAGVIPVNAAGDRWTLQAMEPRSRAVEFSRGDLAHINLAGRYFVPHYAVPMPHVLRAAASLRTAAREEAGEIEVLDVGIVFNVLLRGDPAYSANPRLDRDKDGVACE